MKTGTTSKIFSYSSLVAEATALREAVSLAVSLEARDVLFETYCLDLIETCRGNIIRKELECFINDIKEMVKNFN